MAKIEEVKKYLEEKDWEIEFNEGRGVIFVPPIGIIVEAKELWFHPNKESHPTTLTHLVRDLEGSDFDYVIGEMFGFEGKTIKFLSDYKNEEEFRRQTDALIGTKENTMFR